jgi:uncharacterized OB-fold protein
MYCAHCGTQLIPGQVFCSKCGQQVAGAVAFPLDGGARAAASIIGRPDQRTE